MVLTGTHNVCLEHKLGKYRIFHLKNAIFRDKKEDIGLHRFVNLNKSSSLELQVIALKFGM